jgi:hypothetical protein
MNAKYFFYLVCLSFLSLTFNLAAADLVEVAPVTDKIIRLTFDDGYIENRGTGNDETMIWPLNLKDATLLKSYMITSESDDNYKQGETPLELGRKSKIHDISDKCNWNGEKCLNDYIQYHYIYLVLPHSLQSGDTYTVHVANLADNLDHYTFTFDEKEIRSVAIHTNQLGYSPASGKKYAYVSQWLGTLGGLEIDSYAGNRFDIYPVNPDGSLGTSAFNGTLNKQKDYQTGGPDSDKNDVGPDKNFVKSDVWECDFSTFNTPGEYVLVIEGIGKSYPFRMHLDSYFEAFYYAARAVYFERAITALPEQYAGIYERPEWTDRKIVYTHVRTMDLTDESGNNQKQRIYDSIDYSFDVSNIRGWYHDAGDWDGYFSHFRVPRSLMISYELAPEKFTDGELNIPEAQEANGNGTTNIPDILDEAVWLVDYFKNNIGPTGGIFGSRVHPDISDADGLSNAAFHEGEGFVFEDDEMEVHESWNDYRTWIVHGEDPRDSYAFASIAAQYACNLKIAETQTGEDYAAIIADYQTAAANAYTWAKSNTRSGDEDVKHFVENRAAAAAWLYKLTGVQEYLDQLKADLSAENISSSTTNLGENKWAVWAYVTIDDTDPLYSGTFDATLKTDLIAAVENDAFEKVTQSIEEKNRSMRMGGNFSQPVWNGQTTTPWLLPAMVAYGVTGTQSYLDNCFATADYFLGGNQMNYVWLTLVGHQHPIRILHNDTEHDGIYGSLPGVPPYSPRTRCDWMAFKGNRCDYQGPWDNDFYLLDGRLFPAYADDNGQTQWPVHELWFDQYPSPAGAEFTVHQTIAPAAAAYGFLTSSGETLDKNQAPSVSVSAESLTANAGDTVDLLITAADADGRIYQTEVYQNNRLVKTIPENPGNIPMMFSAPGNYDIFVKVSDNLGLFQFSDTVTITVAASANMPEVYFDMDSEEPEMFLGSAIELKATASNSDKVEFFFFLIHWINKHPNLFHMNGHLQRVDCKKYG